MTEKTDQRNSGQILHDLFREVFALHATLSALIDRVHEQAGLSTSQRKVMQVLDQIEPATVTDIGAMLGVSRQFVQTVCNDLLARGFIKFAGNPRHKRSRLAVSTETGRIAFRKAQQKEKRMIAEALPKIDPDKAAEACDLLNLIRLALIKRQSA